MLLFLVPGAALAHPHVFIEQRLEVRFDDKGLAGFKVAWSFDEMFSVMIADDFDSDQNGILDEKEVGIIREKAFGYIAPHNYYIHITIDGRPFAVKFITEFKAILDKGKLKYEFFIPCHVRAGEGPKNIVVSPYDPEFYSDIFFSKTHPLEVTGNLSFEVATDIRIDKSTFIYYDMVNPWAMFLKFRLKI
ncbi:MAG: DUF1007 family protein [Desulfobacteraceae bacterium]|nr:DUF1007 family protein [Desulfobacteraceae bacterium]